MAYKELFRRQKISETEAKERLLALELLHILRIGYNGKNPITISDLYIVWTEKPTDDLKKSLTFWGDPISLDTPVGDGDARGKQVESLADYVPSDEPTTEEQASLRVGFKEVETLIEDSGLTDRQIQAMKLSCFLGLKSKEIAQIMHLNNRQTVDHSLKVARNKIRRNRQLKQILRLEESVTTG